MLGALISSSRPTSANVKLFNYVGILAVSVVASMLLVYSQYQITSLEKRIALSNLARQRRYAEVEDRVKREVDVVNSQTRIHNVVKRQAKRDKKGRMLEDGRYVTMSSGATYIRWGRRDCTKENEDTIRIYHGAAAGSHISHAGGGSNYICLHNNITYLPGKYVEGSQGTSYIYGVEWRDPAWVYPLLNLRDTMLNAVQFHTVPCALCLARGRHTEITIPGRVECPESFTLEYKGYIMAHHHSDSHASKYICVDERPQVMRGSHGDHKGSSLYMTETQCNSLLCEPVVAGREIPCVVCTI